jgi:hypothetical protein
VGEVSEHQRCQEELENLLAEKGFSEEDFVEKSQQQQPESEPPNFLPEKPVERWVIRMLASVIA